jgi:hypothetical protein
MLPSAEHSLKLSTLTVNFGHRGVLFEIVSTHSFHVVDIYLLS